jgi:uncharacterized protein (TIGR03382 family)
MASRRMQAIIATGALLAAVAVAAPASAATIIATDTWYEFSFTEGGLAAVGCAPADPAGNFCTPSSGTPTTFVGAPSWDIVLAAAGTFTLTDAFLSGDFFELLDFGVVLGPTPLPAVDPVDCGDDPVPCLATPGISSRVYAVAAGAHSFTIVPIDTDGGGSAYFRIDAAAIPAPAPLALLAAAVAWLGFRRLTAAA